MPRKLKNRIPCSNFVGLELVKTPLPQKVAGLLDINTEGTIPVQKRNHFAVGFIARNMTAALGQELEDIVQDMEAAARRFDLARFHKSDVAFHRKLWKSAGNEYLETALERVAFGLFAFVLLQRESESKTEFLAATDQHKQILEGLRSGDPEEARRAFEQSTEKFWKNYH
jgi:DNA-binding GntR family transcriptional regulator